MCQYETANENYIPKIIILSLNSTCMFELVMKNLLQNETEKRKKKERYFGLYKCSEYEKNIELKINNFKIYIN